MDTTSSLNTPRGHRRGPSIDERRRAGLHRQLTSGPLSEPADEEDPLSISTADLSASIPIQIQTQPATKTSRYTPTPTAQATLNPPSQSVRAQSRSPVRAAAASPNVRDFGYLTKPENFHSLPVNSIPQAFLTSKHAPSPDAPLEHLLQNGQFHAAAITSASQLTRLPRPIDPNLAFALLETRLRCLLLINQASLAAAESKIFGDLSNPFYIDAVTGEHLVPWDLRVLCVRLQALGFGEWRRGIMSYYILAQEARSRLSQLHKQSRPSNPAFSLTSKEVQDNEPLWAARLQDLGIRVASALVEMSDPEAAARHLRSLELSSSSPDNPSPTSESQTKALLQMQALVWLKIGDIRAAQRCVRRMLGAVSTPGSPTIAQAPWSPHDTSSDKVVAGSLIALFRMGEGDFQGAASNWRTLLDVEPSNAMVVQNLAICLVYTNKLVEGREVLEGCLREDGGQAGFRGFLFNLCTVYELCGEGSGERKGRLAGEIAALEPRGSGWDKAMADFKL